MVSQDSINMVYPAFRCGHGKLCHMNFLTSTTVLLKEEEFIDQNRTDSSMHYKVQMNEWPLILWRFNCISAKGME